MSAFLGLAFSLNASAADLNEPLEAVYSSEPVALDASLNDPVWKMARHYPLEAIWKEGSLFPPYKERGTARFAWDDHCLYVAVTMADWDLVAEGYEDQMHHYRLGDTVELFLKSATKPCYWEMYGTPRGNKAVFFYPSRGRMFLPSSEKSNLDLKVAVKIEGTLNDYADKDEGWTVLFVVPLKGLRDVGGPFGPEAPEWRVLVSRYNYSVYHEVQGGECSSTSGVINAKGNFHEYEGWRRLRLLK